MEAENRKERGPYRQKEQIAFWYPVSHEEAAIIERARQHHERVEGYAPPQFQMLGRIIRCYDEVVRHAELDEGPEKINQG